ncbi:hypothetical protein EDB85DRAFT_786372 [Lactarius pseudohatsudake]|nr:hypothetical protein EDB85DRAFT_786372 [Lactarius pseudohatsudake]
MLAIVLASASFNSTGVTIWYTYRHQEYSHKSNRDEARKCYGARQYQSIRRFQHYFGHIRKPKFRTTAQRKGLVPAIGSFSAFVESDPQLSSPPELKLPLSLTAASFPPFTRYDDTFEVDSETSSAASRKTCWSLRTTGDYAPPKRSPQTGSSQR